MKKSLLEIINDVLKNSEKGEIKTIDGNMDLRADLGLDSIDLALLTVLIEDVYGIDVFEKRIITKLSEIIEILNE